MSGDVQLADRPGRARCRPRRSAATSSSTRAIARGGRYEFNSHSGNVRIMLAGNVPGFELDASTFSGSIRSDFPVTLRSTAHHGRRCPRRRSAPEQRRAQSRDSRHLRRRERDPRGPELLGQRRHHEEVSCRPQSTVHSPTRNSADLGSLVAESARFHCGLWTVDRGLRARQAAAELVALPLKPLVHRLLRPESSYNGGIVSCRRRSG